MPERADALIEKTEKSPGNLPFALFLTIFHAKSLESGKAWMAGFR